MGCKATLPHLIAMCDLLDILKPHFFPHYACFQYGVGGYELWLSRRCIQYVVTTDTLDDYEFLQEAKLCMDLPSLTPYLAPPDEYRDCILRFGSEHFNLVIVYIEPVDFTASLPEIVTCIKPRGILVLPTRQQPDILLDWKELGEGVYRKP